MTDRGRVRRFTQRARARLTGLCDRAIDQGDKDAARRAVALAVQYGVLVRPPACELCGSGPTEGHHRDYRRPLEVRWLCPTCHRALHLGRDPGAGQRGLVDPGLWRELEEDARLTGRPVADLLNEAIRDRGNRTVERDEEFVARIVARGPLDLPAPRVRRGAALAWLTSVVEEARGG